MQDSSEEKKVKSEAMKDWLLVQKAQKDAQEFAALYHKYWEAIYRFVFKRLADEALVKDVCQHVFIKALNNINKYEYKGFAFSSWLFRIAISEISNIIRVENRQRAVKVKSEDLIYLFDEDSNTEDNPNMEKMVSLLKDLNETDLSIVYIGKTRILNLVTVFRE